MCVCVSLDFLLQDTIWNHACLLPVTPASPCELYPFSGSSSASKTRENQHDPESPPYPPAPQRAFSPAAGPLATGPSIMKLSNNRQSISMQPVWFLGPDVLSLLYREARYLELPVTVSRQLSARCWGCIARVPRYLDTNRRPGQPRHEQGSSFCGLLWIASATRRRGLWTLDTAGPHIVQVLPKTPGIPFYLPSQISIFPFSSSFPPSLYEAVSFQRPIISPSLTFKVCSCLKLHFLSLSQLNELPACYGRLAKITPWAQTITTTFIHTNHSNSPKLTCSFAL